MTIGKKNKEIKKCGFYVVRVFTDILNLFYINSFSCNCQTGDNSKKKTPVTLFKPI